MEELKDILFITTAAYAAFQAYKLLLDEEKRQRRRSKRRIQTQKRNQANRKASSSSDEEPISMPETWGYSMDAIQTSTPKTEANPVECLQIPELKFNPHKKLATGGKFVETEVSKFSDTEFKNRFRVSRSTMEELNERFKDSTEYKHIFKLGNETTIPTNYYVLMFLWFVGNRCTYLEVSKIFNVSLSRSVFIIDAVLQFLYNNSNDYIRFPDTPSEKRICAEDFQDIAEFPDCIGCLLNGNIQVQIPLEEANEMFLTSDVVTASIQAICDSKGKFLDVFVDPTGEAHPVTMFNNSPIHETLREICQGRYHILGNGDYFVREWFLTAFKEEISPGQKLFNKKFNSTYAAALDNLEALKRRFQQLGNMPSLSSNKIKKFIVSCCVLKNICLELNDCFDMEDPLATCARKSEEPIPLEETLHDDAHLRRIGELKRKQIVSQILEE